MTILKRRPTLVIGTLATLFTLKAIIFPTVGGILLAPVYWFMLRMSYQTSMEAKRFKICKRLAQDFDWSPAEMDLYFSDWEMWIHNHTETSLPPHILPPKMEEAVLKTYCLMDDKNRKVMESMYGERLKYMAMEHRGSAIGGQTGIL